MAFQGGLSDSVALLVQQEYCQSVAFGADCQRFSCRIWLLKGDGYQCLCFAGAGARCCPLFKIWIKPARPGSIASARSEEHTSELQSLMRISYAVFCSKKKTSTTTRSVIKV